MTQQGAGWSQTQETASALEGTLTAGRGASLTLAEGADCAPGLVSPPRIPAAVEGIFFFRFFSIISYYMILNIVPCAIQ